MRSHPGLNFDAWTDEQWDAMSTRFAKHVVPHVSGCEVWTASRDRQGYGRFTLGPYGDQQHVSASRAALILRDRVVPDPTTFALHSCDNPPCVRLDHLRWGTAAENAADRVRRGRSSGNGHGPRKLSLVEVCAVRILHSKGVDQRSLAGQFGIHVNTVYKIVTPAQRYLAAIPYAPAPTAVAS